MSEFLRRQNSAPGFLSPGASSLNVTLIGDRAFSRSLSQFNVHDRAKIIKRAMRAALRPGLRPMGGATPRSSGAQTWRHRVRRAKQFGVSHPAHASEAVTISVRERKKDGVIRGRLTYKQGFRHYIFILQRGYRHWKSGGQIAGKTLVSDIIEELTVRAEEDMPRRLAIDVNRTLSKRMRLQFRK